MGVTHEQSSGGAIHLIGEIGGVYGPKRMNTDPGRRGTEVFPNTISVPHGNQTYKIWATAKPTATFYGVNSQRFDYYNVNPSYPKDFGFSELYLVGVTGGVSNTVFRINDRFTIVLGNGDRLQVGEGFRAPVRKMQFITGYGLVDLIGVE